MKIAVIAPTEIPARRANTVQVMKMTQAFVSNGHETRLASPIASPAVTAGNEIERTSPGHHWDDLARHYGLQHQFPIQWFPARSYLRRYDYSLSAVRWARRWGANLVYTRLPQAAALSSSIGTSTILEVHDYPRGRFGTHLFGRFLSGSGSRRLVVITQALVNDLLLNFDVPISSSEARSTGEPTTNRGNFMIIAPDGVDLVRYSELPTPTQARRRLEKNTGLPLPRDRFTVGYTGHLYAGRGTRTLLSLAERLPEMTFLLVGGEPDQVNRLQIQVNERHLTNVVLTGFVPNQELPVYQAACEVLLMPYQKHVAASSGGDISRYLSPMKLFEYMANARAILSSDLPVLGEILNKDNAVLLPVGDINAWVGALQNLQLNPDHRQKLADQARRDVQRYTWKARAGHILEGIDSVKY